MDCLIRQGHLSHHGTALHMSSTPGGNQGAVSYNHEGPKTQMQA